MDAVYFYSRGIPRVINLICEHSLINAFVDQLRHIPAQVVEQVATEFQLTSSAATADLATAQSNFGWLPPQRAAAREPAEAQRAHAAVAGGSSRFPKASPSTQPAPTVADRQALTPVRSASDPLSILEPSPVISASPDTQRAPSFADPQALSSAPSISEPLSILEASPMINAPFTPADASAPAVSAQHRSTPAEPPASIPFAPASDEQPRHWPGIWPAPPREPAPGFSSASASAASSQHLSSSPMPPVSNPYAPTRVSREAYRVPAGNGAREGQRSSQWNVSEEGNRSGDDVSNVENVRRQRHWVSSNPRPSKQFNRWWSARRDWFLSAASAAIHHLLTLPILRWLTTSRRAHQHPAVQQQAVHRRASAPPRTEQRPTDQQSVPRAVTERPSLQRQEVYPKPNPAPLPSRHEPKSHSGYLSTMLRSFRHQRTALVRWLQQPASSPHRR
jgi:hypothetical protein